MGPSPDFLVLCDTGGPGTSFCKPKPSPTPRAPPSTDKAVKSTPTADKANNKPNKRMTARSRFAATFRMDKSLTVCVSMRCSIPADSHRLSTNTKPEDNKPSNRVRKSSFTRPKFRWICSISATTKGSKSVIHNTATPQANQDTNRSVNTAKGERGKTAINTRAHNLIKAKENKIGTANLSKISACCLSSRTCTK